MNHSVDIHIGVMVKGGKKRSDAARHRMGHKATVFMGSVTSSPPTPDTARARLALRSDLGVPFFDT